MKLILHITTEKEWTVAQKNKVYTAPSLASQGFIHCSKPEQVIAVANCNFKGQSNLVMLLIDEEKIAALVKYESEDGVKFFPHIYGTLNLDAVLKVVPFPPSEDGAFELPELNV